MDNESAKSIFESYFLTVKDYLDIIDNIRKIEIDASIELPLPSIVVIGDQSSGKSSILEAISGLQLPKGNGIVTRCPLIIECRNSSIESQTLSYDVPKGVRKTQKVEAGELLEKYIKTAQSDITGSQTISEQEITLHIESPDNPNLTLIDLPGIARCNVMNGDNQSQSDDIHEKTKSLINKYIRNKLSVILCVIQADVDLATSEVLMLAKAVDPNYERTMGIFTRPDMVPMISRVELCETVRNKKYRLGLGYHIVRCRTADEQMQNKSSKQIENESIKLFQDDANYKTLPEENKGVDSLKNKLTANLLNLIKKTLPDLKSKIDEVIVQLKAEIAQLPEELSSEKSEKEKYLFKLRHEFLNRIQRLLLTGEQDLTFKIDQILSEKSVFSEWRECFETLFEELKLTTNDSFRNDFQTEKLRELIEAHRGRHLPEFHNYLLFENLIKSHIGKYKNPAQICLQNIFKITAKHVNQEVKKCFAGFQLLQDYVEKVVIKCGHDQMENCTSQLAFLFQMEDLIFTQDKTFKNALQQTINQTESDVVKNFSVLMNCYLKVVNQRLGDTIPCCIRVCLHQNFYVLLRDRLSESTTDDVPLVNFLVENEDVAQRRQFLTKTVEQLESALTQLK